MSQDKAFDRRISNSNDRALDSPDEFTHRRKREKISSYHHDDPELRRLLLFLLGGKRGSDRRAKIIQLIRERPRNPNQIARELDLDYKVVQHHTHVLMTNSLLVLSGTGYGAVYKLSPWFEYHIDIFDQVCGSIGLEVTKST